MYAYMACLRIVLLETEADWIMILGAGVYIDEFSQFFWIGSLRQSLGARPLFRSTALGLLSSLGCPGLSFGAGNDCA